MKKHLILTTIGIAFTSHAWGVNCTIQTNSPTGNEFGLNQYYCTAGTVYYILRNGVLHHTFTNCTTCNSNTTRTQMSSQENIAGTPLENCDNASTLISGKYYCKCDKTAAFAAQISASIPWQALTTGYQKHIYYLFNNTTCAYDSYTEYRCDSGYYGTTTNGTSGCTKCPTWTGVYTDAARTTLTRGTSNANSNTAITSCYIATGTYYDVRGTFEISSTNCKYTQ